MISIKNVLVATDFSECSETALTYGREFARTFGARLHVLHAVESIPGDGLGVYGYANALPSLQNELEASDRERLEHVLTADDRAMLGGTTSLCSFETPAHAIAVYAKAQNIDLIVLGTHGRRGFSRMAMGSVAETVVRTAPCPVLTVRRTERDVAGIDVTSG